MFIFLRERRLCIFILTMCSSFAHAFLPGSAIKLFGTTSLGKAGAINRAVNREAPLCSSSNLNDKEEYMDEASFTKKWRERRMKELLQQPDLHPSLVTDLLEPNHLERQRHVLAPNEAFGAIFQLDVLTDVASGLLQPMWSIVAKEHNFKPPTVPQCKRALGMLPEKAMKREFHWTHDFATARKISLTFALTVQEAATQSDYKAVAYPGVIDWLKKLKAAGVPCGVVSRLPSTVMDAALQNAGLNEYITAQVSADDDFERDMQGFLKASLKIMRPPGKCVVFDCRPEGIIQAHDGEFKAIAMIGVYPTYELGVADLSIRSMADLRILNVRRLFSGQSSANSQEPQLQTELEKVVKRKPVATRYRDDPEPEVEPKPYPESWSNRSNRPRRR